MRRRVLWQLVIPLLVLCVLFTLLAYPPSQSRSRPDLLELSVIFREADTALWANARQGMEQAASDLDVEVRFLTPAASNDAAEQAQLLERETAGGAGAVLLVPADRAALEDAVAAASAKVPLVTMETDMTAAGAAAWVGTDARDLGEALGQAVLNGVAQGGTVLLVDSAPGDNAVGRRLEAARALLEAEGRRVAVCRPAGEESLGDALERCLAQSPEAVVAFEASALERAAAAVQGAETAPLLYGMGSTAAIAASLEQSRITAIAAQNEFAAGYLAVEAAVRAARHEAAPPVEPLDFALVRQENMYDPDNQKLLFPVTR